MSSEDARELRKDALVQAARVVDGLHLRGEPSLAGQPHAWPRRGVFRPDGSPVLGVPPEIEELTYYIAHNLMAGIPMSDDVRATIQRMVGPLLDPEIKVFDGTVRDH